MKNNDFDLITHFDYFEKKYRVFSSENVFLVTYIIL